MKAYIVGGAVRDRLLGEPVNDRDWVVVGATPEAMVAAGYRPVGRDFPVFLHPDTHEEHALARTERKSRPGYHGFVFRAAPDVTLEQDLARRDLTINAMALDPDTDRVIDPFGGQRDIAARVLRHVSDAFSEDPVRLLRIARFAARWPDFTVADETRALLRQLVASGEVDALQSERVWQELSRGLAEARPSRMIDVLRDTGALARLAPELDAWLADDARSNLLMRVVDDAPAAPPSIRFACLCHGLDTATLPHTPRLEAVCERWRVEADTRMLALLVAREWPAICADDDFSAQQCLELLERADAWRRAGRVSLACRAFDSLAAALTTVTRQRARSRMAALQRALRAAQAVRVASLPAAVRRAAGEGPALGRALREARLQAIGRALAAR
jgi:tRNA nucleotidyltransferase (CCA-adding enzyme)